NPKYANPLTNLPKAEQMAVVREKLLPFLSGSYRPANNAERLAFIEWCKVKKLNHAGASLYAAAFSAEPTLAANLVLGHRYDPACFAALAAAGKGADAAAVDDKEKLRLHRQVLDWLRADLALNARQAETAKPADLVTLRRRLLHWQEDS